MHFYRGTGLSGLRGMKPCVDQLIRPLLFAEKQELIQFAKEEGLMWREDQSNQSDAYTRNYFRNNIFT
jgi:tRNA(Ile)-lysidine synthase